MLQMLIDKLVVVVQAHPEYIIYFLVFLFAVAMVNAYGRSVKQKG